MTLLRRALAAVLGIFALITCVLLVEVFLAYRREYLSTELSFDVQARLGDPAAPPLRFVVLGDSTAAGVGVEKTENTYPYLLAEGLAEKGWEVHMTSFGVSGATTTELRDDQLEEAVAAGPDVALVAIGANDVTHLSSVHKVRTAMAEILTRLEAAGAVVVVTGVPDMRADAFLEPLRSISGWRGRVMSRGIELVADEYGIPFVPLARLTGPYFQNDPGDAYGGDEFHPGVGGYRAWAEAILPYLTRALDEANAAPDA